MQLNRAVAARRPIRNFEIDANVEKQGRKQQWKKGNHSRLRSQLRLLSPPLLPRPRETRQILSLENGSVDWHHVCYFCPRASRPKESD